MLQMSLTSSVLRVSSVKPPCTAVRRRIKHEPFRAACLAACCYGAACSARRFWTSSSCLMAALSIKRCPLPRRMQPTRMIDGGVGQPSRCDAPVRLLPLSCCEPPAIFRISTCGLGSCGLCKWGQLSNEHSATSISRLRLARTQCGKGSAFKPSASATRTRSCE